MIIVKDYDGNSFSDFEEKKVVTSTGISDISITSNIIPVTISVSELDTDTIVVYLTGKSCSRFLKHNMNVLSVGSKLCISVGGEDDSLLNSQSANLLNNLTLQVILPKLKFAKLTWVSSKKTAALVINSGVDFETINATSAAGDIYSYATFKNASLSTTEGNIILNIDAKEDISVDASTFYGNLTASFRNISKFVNFSIAAQSGLFQNNGKGKMKENGYLADILLVSSNGQITIE